MNSCFSYKLPLHERRFEAYITWTTVNNIDSLLVGKMLPQTIGGEYEELIFGIEFVDED